MGDGATAIIDAFLFNSELPMLRYRLGLHASFAVRTIVVESNATHTGQPKPLHALASLTVEEREKYHVRLVQATFPTGAVEAVRCLFAMRLTGSAPNGSTPGHEQACGAEGYRLYLDWNTRVGGTKKLALMIGTMQRRALNHAILEEIVALNRSSAAPLHTAITASSQLLVHVSDVDELLDPRAVAKHTRQWGACMAVRSALFIYSEHCQLTQFRWMRSMLARAEWLAPLLRTHPETELRMVHDGMRILVENGCKHNPAHSPPALGVHFSYFFDTDAILSKLGSIHDGGDTPWSKKLLQNASGMATGDAGGLAAARTAIVRKVRSCEVPIGLTRGLGGILNPTGNADIDDVLPLRKRNVTRAMAIGVLPAMPGWPKHPIWE